MQSQLHKYKTFIKEMHLDSFAHVNNAMYLVLLEEARWDLLNQNGYTLDKIMASQIGPTILEIKIRFLRELKLHEEIVIETQVISYEKKICIVVQRILRGEEICATAELTMSLFDLQMRKLISPTEEWMRALGIQIT